MNKITIAMLGVFTAILFVSGVIAAETESGAIETQQKSATKVDSAFAVKVSPDTRGTNTKAPAVVKGAFANQVTVGSAAKVKIVTTSKNEIIPIYKDSAVKASNKAEFAAPASAQAKANKVETQKVAPATIYVKTNGITKVLNFGDRQIKVPSFFPFAKKAVNLQVVDAGGNEITETTIAEGVEKTIAGVSITPKTITDANNIQIVVSAK